MKKILTLTILFAALLVAAISCKKDDPKPAPGKDDPKNPPTQQKVEVTEVKLDKTTLSLVVGDKETLKATITPTNATDKAVTWSSDKLTVAKVDAKSGEITALAAGEATITAKAGSKTATCKVTVKEKTVAVESVTLNKSEVTLTEGSNITLTATIAPEDATNKEVTWESSNTEIATVDQEGEVTAVATGEAVITAVSKQDETKKAECTITVEEALLVAVESVSLNKTTADVILGETLQLSATITPANATNKNVTWSSSDETIATVDANGEVTAKKEGAATITAQTSDGEYTDVCAITVIPSPITAIAIVPASITIKDGETKQLDLEYTPASSTAPKAVQWASLVPSVVDVDEDGNITGMQVGTAKVQVRLKSNSEITAFCDVTVEPDASLKGIKLNKSTIDLQVGSKEQLTVIYTPEYAENTTIKSWTSSNTAVATVDANGKVTAVAVGTAIITATSQEGSFIATCEVNVAAKIPDIYYTVGGGGGYLYKNGTNLSDFYSTNFRGLIFDGEDDYYLESTDGLKKNYSKYFDIQDIQNPDGYKVFSMNGMAMNHITSDIYILCVCTDNFGNHIDRVGKLSSNKTFTDIEIEYSVVLRVFESIVVTTSGEVVIYGYEEDAFGDTQYYFWKIASNGTVIKAAASFGEIEKYYHLNIDNQGNYWYLCNDNNYPPKLNLYKNGSLDSSISYTENIHSGLIRFVGNDCYVIASKWESVVVYKNGSLFKTFTFEKEVREVRSFDVSSDGDIYFSVNYYTNTTDLYKNTTLLYEGINGSFVAIRE